MRLAFLGSPDAAASVLRALVDDGHDVAVVVTGPDKRRGRNQAPSPTPVKAAAVELGLPVSHAVADVLTVGADLGVVVAFGRIIRPDVLAELAMVNVHFSLLPRWRGAAPVERALLAGDTVTGVCLMQVEEGLDTGGVYRRLAVPIAERESARELTARLADFGARLLVDALEEGLGDPVPQAGEATYASKIGSDELRLDFTRPAGDLARVVRLGRAWTVWRQRRLLVLQAIPEEAPEQSSAEPGTLTSGALVSTARGVLRLLVVQPEGRQPVAGVDWARGARPQPHERLGA